MVTILYTNHFRNSGRMNLNLNFRQKKKVMLIVFFDHNSEVYYQFCSKDQSVNPEYYLGVTKRL